MLYNTFLLTESYAFLKSMNNCCTVPLYSHFFSNTCRIYMVNSRSVTSKTILYNCSKHLWKSLAGIFRKEFLMAVTISSADWNLHPRRFSFKRGKRKKLKITRSGMYGGCNKTTTCWLANSSWTSTERYAGALSCSYSQFLLLRSSGLLRKNCWQNFRVSRCSNCDNLELSPSNSTSLENSDRNSAYSVRRQLPLLERENNWHDIFRYATHAL